jgi:hypothetical protein
MGREDISPTRADTARQRRATETNVPEAIAHAQRLVESRPEGTYTPRWCQEAMYVGDMPSITSALLSRQALVDSD